MHIISSYPKEDDMDWEEYIAETSNFEKLEFIMHCPLWVLFKINKYNGQKQSVEVFCKKGVLKNFPNFTGKHLFWSSFLIKLQAWRTSEHLKNNRRTSERRLLLNASCIHIFFYFKKYVFQGRLKVS